MTWEEMTSMAAEEGFAGCGRDRHEGHPLRSVVPAAVRPRISAENTAQITAVRPTAARRTRCVCAFRRTAMPSCSRRSGRSQTTATRRPSRPRKKNTTPQRCACSAACAARTCPGFPVGASGCALCETCAIVEKKPCRYPDLYYSCMSAYCIFVRRLAEQCGMEYDCGPGLLAFFGMYVFD